MQSNVIDLDIVNDLDSITVDVNESITPITHRETRHQGLTRWAQYIQWRELTALCSELEECMRYYEGPDRHQGLRADWYEAASSARELALVIWPTFVWMHQRPMLPV